MPNRNIQGDYRYGYQGEFAEKEDIGSTNSFELRLWDSRIGRWISPDPKGQFFSSYLGMGNNPISGIDFDGGEVFDIIVRIYNTNTKTYTTALIIESKIYKVTFDIHLPGNLTTHDVVTGSKPMFTPRVIKNFDYFAGIFGKPDALRASLTADVTLGGGSGGALDLTAFLRGPDKGKLFLYAPDFADINIGIGAGVSEEVGLVYSDVPIDNFNRFTLTGPEATIAGSFGPLSVSLFNGLNPPLSGDRGFGTGPGPYHGFTFGGSYGTSSINVIISESRLLNEGRPLNGPLDEADFKSKIGN